MAAPLPQTAALPLIIISHGYPGNRYLMSHAAENLASKGYVVVAIEHRDSTYLDQQPVASAIYHHPLDQVFVLDQVAALAANSNSFLYGIVDTDRTGIIGYSFGGFALVNNVGGGFSESTVNSDVAPVNRLAFRHAADNPEYHDSLDDRIKAGVAVAPWGMASGVWEAEDLAAVRTPILFMAGSTDETSGYEDGVRALFLNAKMSDRFLLTFENAGHNAIAPIPLPIEITRTEEQVGASHYTDAVWDSVRSANIMNHFTTAFFDLHLKGLTDKRAYFDLLTDSNEGRLVHAKRRANRHAYLLAGLSALLGSRPAARTPVAWRVARMGRWRHPPPASSPVHHAGRLSKHCKKNSSRYGCGGAMSSRHSQKLRPKETVQKMPSTFIVRRNSVALTGAYATCKSDYLC